MNITNDIFWSIYDCIANIFQEVELYDKLVTTFNKIKKSMKGFITKLKYFTTQPSSHGDDLIIKKNSLQN